MGVVGGCSLTSGCGTGREQSGLLGRLYQRGAEPGVDRTGFVVWQVGVALVRNSLLLVGGWVWSGRWVWH